MYNKNDIPELEKRIKSVVGSDGQATGPDGQRIIDEITGPSTGLIWNQDEHSLSLADGWIFDDNGDIVNRDTVTGLGAE